MSTKFKTVPNQKVVRVSKPAVKTNFLQIGIEEWQQASRELSQGAFKIWLYLMSNANGYEFALSSSDVCEKTGISQSTYKRAMPELEEKGYLNFSSGITYIAQNEPTRGIKMNQHVVSKRTNTLVQNDTTSGIKMNQEIDKQIITDKIDSTLSSTWEETKRQLITKGISEELIEAMKAAKPQTEWDKYGYGMLFTASYQNQIQTKLNQDAAKAKETELAKEIARTQNPTMYQTGTIVEKSEGKAVVKKNGMGFKF